ncbi:MAG: aminotransferase class I/II-fold pyridoxal phosphate-dependent enzyme, partial [Acidimicrobiia bacterium]|nr:aminotransferase class I/II-fold pyridoxal phosphate-dependent enzyme [Acidimicrobiia bacterium]
MMTASNRSEIAPFYVMEVMKAAAERERTGGEVLHMEVGQPSTSAPSGVLEAAHETISRDRLGYTAATGIPELRDRIGGYYVSRHNIEVDPARIIVTVGASGGCVLSFLAAFDHGDRVAVAEPGYPCYRNMLEAFGVNVVGIPVGPATRYSL